MTTILKKSLDAMNKLNDVKLNSMWHEWKTHSMYKRKTFNSFKKRVAGLIESTVKDIHTFKTERFVFTECEGIRVQVVVIGSCDKKKGWSELEAEASIILTHRMTKVTV